MSSVQELKPAYVDNTAQRGVSDDSHGVLKKIYEVDSKTIDELSDVVQGGVKKMEVTTKTWSKWNLATAYLIIWLIYFVTSTQEVVVRVMTPFVTSSFSLHSLVPATSIMSSIIGGLSKLPLAKLLDTWGRPQGLALMMVIWSLGFVMMAACNNVETYAAAQVFASVGGQGVSYCLTIFIADTTSLRNRSLMLAFATSPYIATTWIGGPISDALLRGPGWRWAFGIFAILIPVVVAPFILLFRWKEHQAKRLGLLEIRKKKLTFASLHRYALAVDLFGILLLAAGMALFLLPFSLWSYQAKQWASPMIICMIVFGAVLIVVFILYEKFFAPVQFIPPKLLADRTVFFGGLMLFFLFFGLALSNSFFSSMLLVVFNQGITKTTYILNIYRIGSCFASLVLGFVIRYTRRFKWVAVYYGLPLVMLGTGLMIHFRMANSGIGYIVMTQIFIAVGGGPLVIAGEMAMWAPSDHQHVAVILAVLDLFCSIGNAVGSTVSGAIWTGTFPRKLRGRLPPDAPVELIYSSIDEQLKYPVGTTTRDGIDLAYGDSQRIMLIASTCILVGALASSLLWRNIKLEKKQTKGVVV